MMGVLKAINNRNQVIGTAPWYGGVDPVEFPALEYRNWFGWKREQLLDRVELWRDDGVRYAIAYGPQVLRPGDKLVVNFHIETEYNILPVVRPSDGETFRR